MNFTIALSLDRSGFARLSNGMTQFESCMQKKEAALNEYSLFLGFGESRN